MIRTKVKSIKLKRYTLPDRTDQAKFLFVREFVNLLEKELYSVIFYTVKGSFKLKQAAYAKTESK